MVQFFPLPFSIALWPSFKATPCCRSTSVFQVAVLVEALTRFRAGFRALGSWYQVLINLPTVGDQLLCCRNPPCDFEHTVILFFFCPSSRRCTVSGSHFGTQVLLVLLWFRICHSLFRHCCLMTKRYSTVEFVAPALKSRYQ